MSIHLSDPRPAYCSSCYNTPDGRYVDFDAEYDAGCFVNRDDQAFIEGSDDLHLCETCVQEACEALGAKPQAMGALRNEVTRLKRQSEYWRSYAKNLEGTLQERPDPPPRALTGRAA